MNERQLQAFQALPPAESCRRIDFEQAELLTLESFPPQYVLAVTGTKPYLNMEVTLVPLVYIQQPDYWGIEVVGCLPGLGLPAQAPYAVSLRLNGSLGTRGIEVMGATRAQRLDVPPQSAPLGNCGEWAAWLDRQPPGPPTLHVTGACEFPSAGYTVELRRREPQGINPRDLLLDKVIHAPTGVAASVLTTVPVRYCEEASMRYETVTILPDGISLPVTETS
jgi:hypothetical protein